MEVASLWKWLLFRAVVRFDGAGLDDDGGVAALEILRRGGHRPRHVTGGEGETRRYHDEQATN